MTAEQMLHRAAQADHLYERLTAVERDREQEGLHEQALEARRLRHEQEAAALYWRARAEGARP
jgi:hypothetical protein